jgi:hypothetical protein
VSIGEIEGPRWFAQRDGASKVDFAVVVIRVKTIEKRVVQVEQFAQFGAASDDESDGAEGDSFSRVALRLADRTADERMSIAHRVLGDVERSVQQREHGALRRREERLVKRQ